jgi:hypothetical protein
MKLNCTEPGTRAQLGYRMLNRGIIKLNSVAWARERTIPTDRPPLVGEVTVRNQCLPGFRWCSSNANSDVVCFPRNSTELTAVHRKRCAVCWKSPVSLESPDKRYCNACKSLIGALYTQIFTCIQVQKPRGLASGSYRPFDWASTSYLVLSERFVQMVAHNEEELSWCIIMEEPISCRWWRTVCSVWVLVKYSQQNDTTKHLRGLRTIPTERPPLVSKVSTNS